MQLENPIDVISELTDSALILHLRGELDLRTARTTGDALLAAADELPPPGLIVLDLTDLDFLAAIGVGILRGFADECAARGVRTHLVFEPGGTVHRVVEILGLGRDIPAYASLRQALRTPA
jgi:anti-anti-sigma factor